VRITLVLVRERYEIDVRICVDKPTGNSFVFRAWISIVIFKSLTFFGNIAFFCALCILKVVVSCNYISIVPINAVFEEKVIIIRRSFVVIFVVILSIVVILIALFGVFVRRHFL
jgi:hypothetical protein